MKTYTATREVVIDGHEFDAEFSFTVSPGRPQAYGQPEEYPEPDVKTIHLISGDARLPVTDAAWEALTEETAWLLKSAAEQDAYACDEAADHAREMAREAQ